MSEAPSEPTKQAEVGALWRHSLAVQRERDKGFDGMLLFVALNRIFSPLFKAYVLYGYLQDLSQINVWQALHDPRYGAYRPWALVGICGSIGAAIGLSFDLILLWLFFLRRRAFRLAMLAFLILNIVLPGSLFAFSFLFGDLALSSLVYAGMAALWGLFWIPYFFYSERVKNTFVR